MPVEKLEGVRFSLNSGARTIEISSDEVIQLFEGVSIKAPDIAASDFGLWSLSSVGNKGEIKYNSFTQPKHILQARNGCVWNPKMKITQVGGKMILSNYTINGEICPDAFWESTFEKIFGTGLDIRDFYATPEGRAVTDIIMGKIFMAMHNGVYDVMYYGSHPLVDDSDENGYYTVEADEFADFLDQMNVSDGGGILTQLDGLADGGNDAHLAGAIAAGDITDGDYTGGTNAITKYFDDLYDIATTDLKTVWDENAENVLILAHPAEFKAYRDHLLTTYNEIPATLQYFVKGANGEMQASRNVLYYDGTPIIKMNGWRRFDRVTGYNIHRLVATARGVFGGAYDVGALPGQSWTGMRIDQRFGGGEGFMGKVYMLSDFKLGTEVLDHELVSMTRIVDTP
jgi:hypothetical protein